MRTPEPGLTKDGTAAPEGVKVVSGDTTYHINHLIAEGGMGAAFLTARVAPDGVSLVVLKVLQPSFVVEAGETAAIIVEKETTALQRLNERVPPTPFVVRM